MESGAARRPYASALRQDQQQATRDRILEALADVLTQQGSATVPAVAERAGVSERTVYRHFPTRDELYRSLFAWVMRLTPDNEPVVETVDDLVAVMRDMFPRFAQRPEVIRALNSNDVGQAMRTGRAAARRKHVQDALASSLEGLDEETQRRATSMVHLVSSSASFLHLRDYWDMSAEEAAEVVEWAVRTLVAAAQDGGSNARRRSPRVGRARTRKLGG